MNIISFVTLSLLIIASDFRKVSITRLDGSQIFVKVPKTTTIADLELLPEIRHTAKVTFVHDSCLLPRAFKIEDLKEENPTLTLVRFENVVEKRILELWKESIQTKSPLLRVHPKSRLDIDLTRFTLRIADFYESDLGIYPIDHLRNHDGMISKIQTIQEKLNQQSFSYHLLKEVEMRQKYLRATVEAYFNPPSTSNSLFFLGMVCLGGGMLYSPILGYNGICMLCSSCAYECNNSRYWSIQKAHYHRELQQLIHNRPEQQIMD